MATWHQQQRPVKLWHETLYTAVDDGYNKFCSVMRFENKQECEEYCERTGNYMILPYKETK